MESEQEVSVPIYVINGFLDSGKTSFLNFTIAQDYFQIEGPTLLIVLEQGEEEYDSQMLLKNGTLIEYVESKEDFTPKLLSKYHSKYHPERVLIEFNSLWDIKELEAMKFEKGWGIVQEIVLVDAKTFKIYSANMKSTFVDMFRNADMVSFNRATLNMELSSYRRSIKVVNPQAEIMFEDNEGNLLDFKEELPYDLSRDVVEIEDIDFGIFYVDAQDNPDKYQNKVVSFLGRAIKSKNPLADYFIPARSAMTCCAADISMIGFLCKSKYTKQITQGDWVRVTAKINYERRLEYGGAKAPVLYAERIERASAPQVELVTFS